MAREDVAISVEGLAELRRSLRSLDRGALKEVQAVTRSAAEIVAAEASVLAPRRTGRLAASIRAGTRGDWGIVRSPLPYANVIHWGGTTGRGHSRTHLGATRIHGRAFIYDAFEVKSGEVTRALERGFDDLFRRNGWGTIAGRAPLKVSRLG